MTQILSDGFESGDFNAWTGTTVQSGQTVQVQSSISHHGTYAARMTLDDGYNTGYTYKTISDSYSTLYARGYFRIANMPSSDHDMILLSLTSTSQYNISGVIAGLGIKNVGGVAKWCLQYRNWSMINEDVIDSPLPTTNTFYCLEIKGTINASSGEARGYINGTEIFTKTGLNNNGAGSIFQSFQAGLMNYGSGGGYREVYADCIVVSDSYIDPEPTYYTKNVTDTLAASETTFNAKNINMGLIPITPVPLGTPDKYFSNVYTYQVTTNGINVSANMQVGGNATINGPLSANSISTNGNANVGNINVASGLTLNNNAGTNGQVLTSNGAGNNPTWQTQSTYITSIASGQPFNVSNGALSLNVSSPLQISGNSLGVNSSASPIFAGLKVTDGLAVWSTLNDRINNAPWYGIGYTNVDSGSGFNYTQLAGYYGLKFKTASGDINIDMNGGMINKCGIAIEHVYEHLSLPNPLLPTESQQYKTYRELGYGNIQFKHTGSENANHTYPDQGIYANIYMVMMPDPLVQTMFTPIIAMDRGLFVDKDIHTYGAVMTTSDPAQTTGGGAILMGHGFNSPSTPPRFSLTDAFLSYASGTSWPQQEWKEGQCFNRTDTNAPQGPGLYRYGYYGTPSPTLQWHRTGDYCGGFFNTLHLDMYNPNTEQVEPADLDLRNITIHGNITGSNNSPICLGGSMYITGNYQDSVSGYGYLNSAGEHPYLPTSTGSVYVSLRTSYRIFCGGEIDVTSDQRDKNYLSTLDSQTSLNAIMKLNPVQFIWKPETKKGENVVAGFFAQEVAKAVPEAVVVHEGERYSDEHTLNYNVLTTYALSAIQGLNNQCQDNATKINALTEETQDLRAMIQRLSKEGAN